MEHQTKRTSQKKNLKWMKAIMGRKLGTLNVVGKGMFWAD